MEGKKHFLPKFKSPPPPRPEKIFEGGDYFFTKIDQTGIDISNISVP